MKAFTYLSLSWESTISPSRQLNQFQFQTYSRISQNPTVAAFVGSLLCRVANWKVDYYVNFYYYLWTSTSFQIIWKDVAYQEEGCFEISVLNYYPSNYGSVFTITVSLTFFFCVFCKLLDRRFRAAVMTMFNSLHMIQVVSGIHSQLGKTLANLLLLICFCWLFCWEEVFGDSEGFMNKWTTHKD